MIGDPGSGVSYSGVLAGRFVPGALSLATGVPRRLSDVDETEFTLCLDAVRALLDEAKVDPGRLAGITIASRDAEATADRVAKALGRRDLDVVGVRASREAAGRALVDGFESAAGADGPILFAAAQDTTWLALRDDASPSHAGAGAAALLLGPEAPVRLETVSVRTLDDGPILKPLLDDAGAGRLAVATADPREQKTLLRGVPADRVAPTAVAQLGDLGGVAPLAALLDALAASGPGETVSLVVPGTTRARVLRFQVEEPPRVDAPMQVLERDGAHEVDAATADRCRLAWAEKGALGPRGAYVPLSVFHSQDGARLRMEGQRCLACRRLLFPPRQRCPGCGGDRFEPHRFKPEGHVHSVTRIGKGGAPGEFSPLQEARGAYGVAIVELDGGPRVAAMLTGARMDGAGVKIADPVRLVVRLAYVQDGVPRYSFKALPGNRPEPS